MIARILLFLLALLIASPAFGQAGAVNDWTTCSGVSPGTISTKVGDGDILCYEFDDDQGGTRVTFNITATAASVCLNRDTASTGGDAAIDVDWCAPGTAATDNTCTTIDAITTDDCKSYSSGFYGIDVTVAGSGEDAKVSIRGY